MFCEEARIFYILWRIINCSFLFFWSSGAKDIHNDLKSKRDDVSCVSFWTFSEKNKKLLSWFFQRINFCRSFIHYAFRTRKNFHDKASVEKKNNIKIKLASSKKIAVITWSVFFWDLCCILTKRKQQSFRNKYFLKV